MSISPQTFDKQLKRHQLALLLYANRVWSDVLPQGLEHLGPWAYGDHTYVNWTDRLVLLELSHLFDGFMVHELVHAAYEAPPDNMGSESGSWMYAVERQLSVEWRMLSDWLYYHEDTPIEGVEGYGQIFWKDMTPRQQRESMDIWFEFMNDSGIHFEPSGRKLRPLPVFDGQVVSRVPRGLLDLVDGKIVPRFP